MSDLLLLVLKVLYSPFRREHGGIASMFIRPDQCLSSFRLSWAYSINPANYSPDIVAEPFQANSSCRLPDSKCCGDRIKRQRSVISTFVEIHKTYERSTINHPSSSSSFLSVFAAFPTSIQSSCSPSHSFRVLRNMAGCSLRTPCNGEGSLHAGDAK